MNYVQGGELKDLLFNEGTFDEDTGKFYAIQIIDAVRYLHRKNIVHRDLKLENILIDDRGYLQIIDFGIAKRLDSLD